MADLKKGHTGASGQAVQAVFAEARAAAPTVLFLDEMDRVGTKRGSETEDSFTRDIVTQLLIEMDGAAKAERPVFVLGATNLPDTLDNAILSRFDTKIEIPPPDEAGRAEILKRVLVEKPLEPGLDVSEIAAAMAKLTPGMSGRDLLKLVGRAAARATTIEPDPEKVRLTRSLLMETVADAVKDSSDAVDDDARWNSLVVSDQTMAKLKQISQGLRNMEARHEAGHRAAARRDPVRAAGNRQDADRQDARQRERREFLLEETVRPDEQLSGGRRKERQDGVRRGQDQGARASSSSTSSSRSPPREARAA